MMYEVYVDDKILYYPNDETYAVVNAKLELALNEAGSFECDIPTYNLRYNDFRLRKSMIRVLQNDVEIFYGEVREVRTNADFTKHIYAVGELAFLFDSIQPQGRYLTSPYDALTKIVDKHNAQVEDRKKYTVNSVEITDRDNQIYFYTNGEDTLTIIREKICDVLDGYIRVTKDAQGNRRISIVPLSSFGQCKQEIQFGENLLDYSYNMSASDIATCVMPRGAKLDEENRTKDAVEGLDEYLTIKGTSADYYHKKVENDYVQLDEAIANFGYVRVMKTWDDVTIADNLKAKAIEWLKSAQYENMTLELKALDLSQLDVNIDSFGLGQSVRVWALPYGMDTRLPVRKKTIYLGELEKNEIVLGNTYQQGFTSQSSKAVELLKEELPQTSPVLQQAKDNALAMLSSPDGGYVTYIFDDKGNRTEIWIADNIDSTKATRKWVWNRNGLGYIYKDASGTWQTNVAMTIDGAILANMITAGTLKLAGNGSSATLEIYNGNTLIGKWDKDGILISKGVIKSGNYVYYGGNYSANGTEIDLNNGHIRSKNFAIDDSGNAYYNGTVSVDKLTGDTLTGFRLISAENSDYVDVNKGDIFGGSSAGQHGYLTFSVKDGFLKGVALIGHDFINLVASSIRTFGNVVINGILNVEDAMGVKGSINSETGIHSDHNIVAEEWVIGDVLKANNQVQGKTFIATEMVQGTNLMATETVQGETVRGNKFISNGYEGKTQKITFIDGEGSYHTLNVQNGIIVGFA